MTGPVDDTCQNLYENYTYLFNNLIKLKFCRYTWICILGVTIPYLVFVCPKLYLLYGPVLPVINALLFFVTILFLMLTGFTDPGIIPRKEVLELYGHDSEFFSQ